MKVGVILLMSFIFKTRKRHGVHMIVAQGKMDNQKGEWVLNEG